MNIALDMMGGDFAPEETAKSVELFFSKPRENVHISLIGDEQQIKAQLANFKVESEAFSIIHTSQAIEMHEHPTKALKEKPDSSIAVGFNLLSSGKVDAFISAGNTGAMMVGALFSIKAVEGVSRPAIGAYLPQENGKLSLMVDVGLNSDCKPENLSQFATLGSLFADHILNISNPRVALINLGSEEGKGNLLTQAAFSLLKENSQINFIGNAEGRDLLNDMADIYVCDGFTGNVVLKFAESIYDIVQRREIVDEHFNRFNFEIYGGVPVLGVNKPVIIGHGISHALAFVNMIEMAKKMYDEKLTEKIRSSFSMNK
ncbi:MAG: phosphate acyltransferase PlsX [Bacteroidota bacterium]|nr:phosphate acyltransferase PlsX [Bacteroidota bacterium]